MKKPRTSRISELQICGVDTRAILFLAPERLCEKREEKVPGGQNRIWKSVDRTARSYGVS
jgi:hypothetical protein